MAASWSDWGDSAEKRRVQRFFFSALQTIRMRASLPHFVRRSFDFLLFRDDYTTSVFIRAITS